MTLPAPRSPRLPLAAALTVVGIGCDASEPDAAPAVSDPSSALASIPIDEERAPVLFDEALPPITDWLADNIERRDAAFDGWMTEVLHDRARQALEDFLTAALHPEEHELSATVAPDFRTTALVPAELETLLDQDGMRVLRGAAAPSAEHGIDDVAALARPLARRDDVREQHKIVSLERRADDRFATRALVQIECRGDEGRTQHNLTLDLEWLVTPAEDGEHVALGRLEVVAYEQVQFAMRPLVDVTESAFGSLAAWPDELLLGVEHYHLATDKLIGQSFLGMQGISVGDVNGDGLDDVFVCQQAGLPNRLLLRRPDGSLVDESRPANLALIDRTRSALILDFDGDGARDIALAVGPRLVVLYNRGDGTFPELREWRLSTPTGPSPPGAAGVVLPCPDESEIYGLNAADVDRDGDLDIYVMRYGVGGVTGSVPTPYHDARNGSTNHLWRNEGERSWSDATEALGLDEGNDRYSLASIFEDFDEDGDLDLYVTNDFGRNNYYEFEAGRFRDVAETNGTLDQAAGMGATVADIDADGDADILVSNMFSSAGLRIASQPDRYMGGQHAELHDDYVFHARGNTLLTNAGDGTFTDTTEAAGVALGRWAWGAFFFDLNADGLEDIYVPNGFVTNRDPDDLRGFFWRRVTGQSPVGATPTEAYQNAWSSIQYMVRYSHASWNGRERNCVYLNLGAGRFANVSGASGGDWIDDSRSVVPLDWDADGRLDLLLKNRTGPRVRLLRNVAPRRHWLSVRVDGVAPNVDAIGATVEVEVGDRRIAKTVHAAEGFLAQPSRELYFGLGDASDVRALHVRWPDGETLEIRGPSVDRAVRVYREGGRGKVAVLERPYAGCLDDVEPRDVTAPAGSCRRIVLGARLPVAPVAVPGFDEPNRTVFDLMDRGPVIVNLWATWCAPCRVELQEFHDRAPELAAAGLNVVPLSTDEVGNLAKARKLARELELTAAGYADRRTLAQIEIVLLEVLGTFDEIPIPTSLLLDEKGQLVTIYLGAPGVDRLLADVEALKKMSPKKRVPTHLLGGPWFGIVPRNLQRVRRMFAQTGFTEAAAFYAELVRARRGLPPAPPDER